MARFLPLFLCLATGLSSCGEPPSATESPSAASQATTSAARQLPGPRLVFENTLLNFGEVWDTQLIKGSFAFTNAGDDVLTIEEIKPSCGCTTTELDPMTYAPGRTNAIEVVWDPEGFGPQTKTIVVRSDSVGEGFETLTIRAQIKPFVRFTGPAVQLGNLPEGLEHRHRMGLTCVDPNFELLDLSASSPHVRIENLGPQADGSLGLDVIVDAATPWGQLTTQITARVRGQVPGEAGIIEHEAHVRLQASIINKLEVSPLMFAVGHVLPGRSFERTVRLRRTDGLSFKVTRADVSNAVPADIQVAIEPFKIGVTEGVILRLKGQSADYLGLVRALVTFETDIPGEGPRKLPVMGIVRE